MTESNKEQYEDDAPEFHVAVRHKHIRKGATTQVAVGRSAGVTNQAEAEEHVRKHHPKLEVIGPAKPEDAAKPEPVKSGVAQVLSPVEGISSPRPEGQPA